MRSNGQRWTPKRSTRRTPPRCDRLLDAGLYEGFPEPALYVYRLRSADHEQTGIVGEVPPQAFVDGRVLGHEGVQPERVDALGLHLARLGARSTLVALMFRADDDIRKIVEATTDASTAPEVRHGRSRTERVADRRSGVHRTDPGASRAAAAVHHRRTSSSDGVRGALGASRPAGGRRRAGRALPGGCAEDAGVPSADRRPAPDVRGRAALPAPGAVDGGGRRRPSRSNGGSSGSTWADAGIGSCLRGTSGRGGGVARRLATPPRGPGADLRFRGGRRPRPRVRLGRGSTRGADQAGGRGRRGGVHADASDLRPVRGGGGPPRADAGEGDVLRSEAAVGSLPEARRRRGDPRTCPSPRDGGPSLDRLG